MPRPGVLNNVTRRLPAPGRIPQACALACRWTALALAGSSLVACTTVTDGLASSKVDYRSAAAVKAPTLDVPPDLTQLANDPRYAPPAGAPVSASALQQAGSSGIGIAAPSATNVAPLSSRDLRIERHGETRWLVSPQTPEQLWPLLREFWQANGFVLQLDQPEIGVMETDWAENRARLPQDFVRRTVGRVFDNAFDSGERDRYRTRVERRPEGGSEVYISHRGIAEELVGDLKDQVRWSPRPSEPGLEAEMLARLMLRLSPQDETRPSAQATAQAVRSVTQAPAPAARARVLDGRPAATLQIDDGFERTWRRVGQALDRGGFTLEDRDRAQGLYFVRYVDPKLAGKEDPNFLQRMFGARKEDLAGSRYRLKISAQGSASSLLEVLDADGQPRADEGARSITQLLLPQLR